MEPLPPGSQWYAVIKMVTPDAWIRILTANREGLDTDVRETVARLIFDNETTPDVLELEAAIITAAVAEE